MCVYDALCEPLSGFMIKFFLRCKNRFHARIFQAILLKMKLKISASWENVWLKWEKFVSHLYDLTEHNKHLKGQVLIAN